MTPGSPLQSPGFVDSQSMLAALISNPEEILPGLLRTLKGEVESTIEPTMVQAALIQALQEESLAALGRVILRAFEQSPWVIPEEQGRELVSLLGDEDPLIRGALYRLIRDGKVSIEPIELIERTQGEDDALARCYAIEALTAKRVRDAIPLLMAWQRDLGSPLGNDEAPEIQAVRAALGSSALSSFAASAK